MKNISDIYETILDSDTDVTTGVKRSLITREYLAKEFKNCLPEIRPDDVTILDDGKLALTHTNYDMRSNGICLIKDLPDLIQFSVFDIDNDIVINISGDDVTTLQGLPADLSTHEMYIDNCPNLKDTSAVKSCKVLYIRNTDVSKLKYLPKALKFIRLTGNCGDVDEKYVSKISGTPKNKVTIL